jgi:hypothetical protein
VLGDLADLVVAVQALALLLDPLADRAHDLLDVDGVRLDLEGQLLSPPPYPSPRGGREIARLEPTP